MTLKGFIWLCPWGVGILPLPVYRRMGQTWKGRVWFHPSEFHKHGDTVCGFLGDVLGSGDYELPLPIDTNREGKWLVLKYRLVLE
jgi:hypothetical protein